MPQEVFDNRQEADGTSRSDAACNLDREMNSSPTVGRKRVPV